MIDGGSPAIVLGHDPHGSATRDRRHPGRLRSPVLPRRLDQSPGPRRRGHPGHRPAHRLLRAADHRQSPGATLHQLPPRPQPRRLVLPGRRTDPPGPDPGPDPRRLPDRPGRRRHHRATLRPPDHGPGMLSRCRPLVAGPPRAMLRPEVDRPDRVGPGALESAGLGLAVADDPELAPGRRPTDRP